MIHKILKKGLALVFTLTMCATLAGGQETAQAFTSDNGDGTFTNPVIFSDVPDEDIIRVDDAYYMISTTMHLSPGAPIMKSYDLVNWEIVNYVYDYLEEDDARSLKNGKSDYAYGSWAASLRYDKYQKRYYVTFSSQTTPKSYFFTTDDIEHGSWHRSETEKCYDSSFLFVDTGSECKKYMIIPVSKQGTKADGSKYSYNQTEMCELLVDQQTWDVSLGLERTLLIDNNNYENPPAGLAAEGVHAYKIGEYYYFFMIQGASNPVRQQLCWRSKTLTHGSFEVKKVFTGGIVDEDGKTVNSSWGVAQGGIVQTPEGDWYSIMFQDYHSVGRIPVLVRSHGATTDGRYLATKENPYHRCSLSLCPVMRKRASSNRMNSIIIRSETSTTRQKRIRRSRPAPRRTNWNSAWIPWKKTNLVTTARI